MAKLWDGRKCGTVEITEIKYNGFVVHSAKYGGKALLASVSLKCYTEDGIYLGEVNSSSSADARIPFFVVASGLSETPSQHKTIMLIQESIPQFIKWLDEQVFNLTAIEQSVSNG